MATKIVTKNSSTASAVPTASDLVQGELAVNVADKRLFTEDNAGAIVELGTNPSGNVTFQDNGKAIFGASGDLQIYHDGSNSYIKDLGTGDLLLSGNAGVQIQSDAGENMITTAANGAVSLFYDASAKLATTSTGIDVTGSVVADGLTVDGAAFAGMNIQAGASSVAAIDFGDSADTNIGGVNYNNANDTLNLRSGNLNRLTAASNGDISFYEDTGSTAKLTWSAANESLTFGTNLAITTNEIDVASGDLTLDVAGDIILDAGGADVTFKNSGTEFGRVFGSSDNFYIQARQSDKDMIFQGIDGGSTITALTLDMSAAGFATFNDGISAKKHLIQTAGEIEFDFNGIGEHFTGGNSPHIFAGEGSSSTYLAGTLNFQSRQTVARDINFITGTTPAVALNIEGATGAATFSSSVTVASTLFLSPEGSNDLIRSTGGVLYLKSNQLSVQDNSGVEFFGTSSAGTVFNNGSADLDFRVESDSNANMLFVDGGNNVVNIGHATNTVGTSSGTLMVNFVGNVANGIKIRDTRGEAGTNNMMVFVRGDSGVGSITSTTSATAYNTSSDQRLKENIADADDSGSKVDAIQVRKFNWKADGSHQDYGMIAQELQTVAPEAVSAPENPDEMMGVDYSKLVPMLVKEIQTLRARVADLES